MKKLFFSLTIVSAAILMTGCPARSLHPLLTEKDALILPELAGPWANVESPTDIVTFRQSGSNSYEMIFSDDKGETVVYEALLGKIGKHWFLDTFPKARNEDFHYLPTHILSQVWINGDTLRIANLEGDWLRRMIDAGKLAIRHVRIDDEVILTDSTGELRKLLHQFADDPEAFPDHSTLFRKR